jgi:hypothetical protein
MTREPVRYGGTRIAEPPTFEGRAGKAWRLTMPPPGERPLRDHDGTVGGFIVNAQGAHPFWDHWMISVVHLRPIEGVQPATIVVEGATHELMIAAIDPELPLPSLDAATESWRVHWLRPIDVLEQFQAKDDAVAHQILELAVQAIVGGYASPDQDWRRWWKNAVASTAERYASGVQSIGRLQ